MKKTNKSFLLLGLMSIACFSNIVAKQSSIDAFVQGACAVGLSIIGVAGAVKLAEWCFTETDRQLVTRGEAEYSNALSYPDVINMFEKAYGISGGVSHPNSIVRNVSEPILYDMATLLWHKGLSQNSYVQHVVNANNKLKALSSKLHKRINEQRGRYLSCDERKVCDAMNDLVCRVDQFLPRISLLSDYLEYHKSYFSLYDCESKIYRDYNEELRIIKNDTCGSVIAYDLRQAIVWHYSSYKYPFIAFVDQLDSNISSLKSSVWYAPCYYSERIGFANSLLMSLDYIKRIAVADDRYAQEVYRKEQERLERLRIEALQEQARIERAKLDALQEQNRILERNNDLRRQDLNRQNGTAQQSVTEVSVVVDMR